jgi:putative AlgH/UPF0301 family transcriptional regulator
MTLPILTRIANLACGLRQDQGDSDECRNGSSMQKKKPKTSSLEGQLLVASPYMQNSFFARTVVLVLQHGDKGTVGIILNRPLGIASKSVWEQLNPLCENDRNTR